MKASKRTSSPLPELESEARHPLRLEFVHLLSLVGLLLFVVTCRVRLADVPLERDEGEYAYVAQQWLQGILPFESIYHVKLPGTYAAYAAILALFGETHTAIHLGLLVVNLLSAWIIFLLGRRLLDVRSGIVAAAFFCVASLSQSTLGFSANAEHFVLLPALAGLWFLIRALPTNGDHPGGTMNLFFAGLFLGLGVIMKQHGLFFLAFAGLYLVYTSLTHRPFSLLDLLRNGSLLSLGAVIPYGCICLLFYHFGLFPKFWWWTFHYPRSYVDQIDAEAARTYFMMGSSAIRQVLWPIALLSMMGVLGSFRMAGRGLSVFLLGWLCLSAAAVSVGFYFYPHYFLLLMPALCVSAAAGVYYLGKLTFGNRAGWLRHSGAVVAGLVLFIAIYSEREYLFRMEPRMVCRTSYGGNPFPESLDIARYLEKHTKPDDRIAVLGSEPQIFFYAKRRSATGYVYVYEMMKDHPHVHRFQEEMVMEIEQAAPAYIVSVNIQASWVATPVKKIDDHLLTNANRLIGNLYEQVGIVDIPWPQSSRALYCWDSGTKHCAPRTGQWISLYRRKSLPGPS